MSDNFNGQNDVLLSIKREINLLQQQVDFLIRNGKPLGLLDLDVMMNRTHTLYSMMCGVEVEEGSQATATETQEMDNNEELPVGLEEIRSLFGIEEEEDPTSKPAEEQAPISNPIEEEPTAISTEEDEEEIDEATEELLDQPEEEPAEEDPASFEEEIPDETEDETLEETPAEEDLVTVPDEEETPEEDESAYFIEEADDEEPEAPTSVPTEEETPTTVPVETPEEPQHNSVDDLGFILNFEPVNPDPEPTPEPELDPEPESSFFTTGDQIEMEIPHDPVEPAAPVDPEPAFSSEEVSDYEPVMIGEMEPQADDDDGFELERPETLADRYQHQQEETVGEKLQHGTVGDLHKAIGINDKFLFVNELFNGSMEKYNRSIENLNDLKTLNGALIYLNELRIELQWNSNNEAYKKLLELTHRKFEA